MNTKKNKVVITIVSFLLIVATVFAMLGVKNIVLKNLYSENIQTRIVIDACPYIGEFENAISNGEDLSTYEKTSPLLQEIMKTSSYIKGVFILDSQGACVSSLGEGYVESERASFEKNESFYYMFQSGKYAFLYVNMGNQISAQPSQLMIVLDKGIVINPLNESKSFDVLFALAVIAIIFAIALIVLVRLKIKDENIKQAMLIFFSAIVLITMITGFIFSIVQITYHSEEMTNTTAQRAAQLMQVEINADGDNNPYDPNGYTTKLAANRWLTNNQEKISQIRIVTIGEYQNAIVQPSKNYITSQTTSYIMKVCIVLVAELILLAILAFVLIAKVRKKATNYINNDYSEYFDDMLEEYHQNQIQFENTQNQGSLQINEQSPDFVEDYQEDVPLLSADDDFKLEFDSNFDDYCNTANKENINNQAQIEETVQIKNQVVGYFETYQNEDEQPSDIADKAKQNSVANFDDYFNMVNADENQIVSFEKSQNPNE